MMEKLELLESVLGKGHKANRTYFQFTCPFCNHYKPKLGIDINNGNWKCWVCNTKGSNIGTLFFKLQIDNTKVKTAKELWKEKVEIAQPDVVNLKLPNGFQLLSKVKSTDVKYKQALKYITSRNVSIKDIMKHKIGYNDDGYLIFPNYDIYNNLTFYSMRSYIPDKKMPHILANVNKNIIGDENLVNWEEDIILCESKLDAIVIKRNAVPLFGKIISRKLKEKIIESPLENIYMCLDGDANDDIIQNAKYFIQNGKNVFHCNLPPDRDPNSLGFEEVWEYINNAKKITSTNTFEHEILNKLKR
jgi:hypothetical protein